MRVEIRKDGGAKCELCGSYELIHVAPDHEALVKTVKLSAPEVKWYHPFAKRYVAKLEQSLKNDLEELVSKTRFPIS